MQAYLSDFHHLRPPYEIEQEKTLDWIAEAHARASKREQQLDREGCDAFRVQIRDRLIRIGLGKERIQKRGTILSDFLEQDWSKMHIYPVDESPHGKGFTQRSEFFDREVSKIFEQFYPGETALPAHLIHVTCTGYVSPSPAQKLVSSRGAGATTVVTHAYHMGCFGAMKAVRIGAGYAALPSSSKIDIVHSEVCSLHLHPLRHQMEQLLVESLFADGFIKYTLSRKKKKGLHLKVLALHEETIPDSTHAMSWSCEDHGLGMTLSKEVPVLIARSIDSFLQRLCTMAKLDKEKTVKGAFFAVHPGGPKILQHIKELLHLQRHQIEYSEQVLMDFGNMSSATLPHIWERMLSCEKVPSKALIIGLAYGPGLCVTGGLFTKGM